MSKPSLREKEAQKIRAKENKPLYDARLLTKDKEFPHLKRKEGNPIMQNTPAADTRGYAMAARAQQERPVQSVPEQNSEPSTSNGTSEVTTMEQAQDVRQAPSTQCQAGTCQHSAFDIKYIEASVTRIVKKAISKLLSGLSHLVLSIAQLTKESDVKDKTNTIENSIMSALEEALQSESDSEEEEEEVEIEEENEEEGPSEAISVPLSRKFLKSVTNQDKRPAKANK